MIPRLAVVLSLVAFGSSIHAQVKNGTLADGPPQVTSPDPAAQIDTPAASLPDLVRRVKASVVSVLTYDAKGEPLISGSGFFVRPGEVITNMHVIKGAHRVEIHTLD